MYRDDWYHAERLHRAAADGDCALAKSLIAEGVPLDAFEDIGFTPLHFAVRHEHFAMAQLLLDAGANINAREEETNSHTAISVAARETSPEMVEFLLTRGADPWIAGWMGMDAFDLANDRRDDEAPQVRAVLASYAKEHGRAV
jgi:ankyrin repeat protein